ncbi:hypothetical protein A2U01_0048372, partial [Trifolium medium]|nr:hypothetical protein [Trifolium medium]
MEEERQCEQIDRKRIRSISLWSRSHIRLRRSFGSSDQFAATAMDSAA